MPNERLSSNKKVTKNAVREMDNSYYESSTSVANGGGDLEMLDQELEELQITIESFGFPDCGNLRSTKKKDVRMRMKCFQAMIKQRQKDLKFKSSF
jgi:hypothetical protein